nr:MAG TPA: hypothetical protein [Caudoviricetes sp.]
MYVDKDKVYRFYTDYTETSKQDKALDKVN